MLEVVLVVYGIFVCGGDLALERVGLVTVLPIDYWVFKLDLVGGAGACTGLLDFVRDDYLTAVEPDDDADDIEER